MTTLTGTRMVEISHANVTNVETKGDKMAIRAPIAKLKKTEIQWLSMNKCRHNHTYLEHYACFLKEIVDGTDWAPGGRTPIPDHIGYFDIEASNLAANFGIMLCYCILDNDTGVIKESVIPNGSNASYDILVKDLDKNVINDLISDLSQFDRVITYYGTRYDLPFSRTRALYHDLNFPTFQELVHTDVYYMVKSKLKLHSSRLEVACDTILGESNKTRFRADIWTRAQMGDSKSLEYVIDHCRKDVIDLRKLHHKMSPFVGRRRTSV